jgi:uncharacterized protein (TIGR02996 family)
MRDEDAFLRAIAGSPDDRATRLVFTDWLLERGDERAEFVRLDSALRAMTGDEPAFAEMEASWRDWRARLPRLWLTAFGHLFTSEELRREAARAETFTLVAEGLRTVAVTRELHFLPDDFQVPAGEQHLSLIWGRRDVMSGLRFWLESAHGEVWGHSIHPPQSFPCTPLTEASWRKAVESHLSCLRAPPPSPYPGKGSFIAAVHIEGDWCSQGWLAAYTEEYIAAVWHTTA